MLVAINEQELVCLALALGSAVGHWEQKIQFWPPNANARQEQQCEPMQIGPLIQQTTSDKVHPSE